MTEIPRSSPFPSGSRPGGTGPGSSQLTTPASSGIIGRYQILDKIGEGGMGSLYLARDPAIDRLVAIKLLRRGFDTDALRERFAREARAAGRLRHPNIVTIFDVGEHDGDPFIAREFLAGETLGELIRHGAGLSLGRRLKLLEELCDGLAYAHRAGLVHRDIKPANLMVDAEGVLKILDFGIVRVSDSGMTQAGVLVGTINYMSPEQVVGTNVDHRSDIFAVGLVAYELLSGRQAFQGTMKDGLLRRIPNAEIEPLAGVAPRLDPEVIGIVERALKKEPADRYQELARMRNDLARVRQRIEAEEERAAIEAASASDETALIAEAVTEAGVPMERPPTPAPAGPAADAERALAEGNYRIALSMAARLAALNPHDKSPNTIVARAEQALLERGRTIESSRPLTPHSAAGAVAAPSDAPPVSSAPAPSTPSTPASTAVGAQHANYVAIGVAVVALMVAGFAVMSQVGPSGPAGEGAGGPGQTTSEPGPGGQAGPPGPSGPAGGEQQADGGDQPPATAPPAGDSSGPPDKASPRLEEPAARGPDTPAGGGEARPQRTTRAPAEAAAPPRSPARRGAAPARPEPRQEPRREPQQPPQQPPSGGGAPPVSELPEVKPANPAGLPIPDGPRPSSPPPPAPPVKPKPSSEAAPRSSPPPRNPRAEAEAAVESLLRRYEAAWEALDFAALQRVWDMPDPRSVRESMSRMREYALDVVRKDVEISEDAQRATAVCTMAIRFRQVGSSQEATVVQTFTFQKRGETWMITGLR